MTSPTSTAIDSRRRRRSLRQAFTLVELIVVLGIILVLVGLLLPAITKAWKSAARASIATDLQAIAQALEAYKADHTDYPRLTGMPVAANVGYDGAVALCQALIGPSDADDLDADTTKHIGFRVRPDGKLYPNYLPLDRFKMRAINAMPPGEPEQTFVLLDRYDTPILYFPASTAKLNVRITTGTPYVGTTDATRYDTRDNLGSTANPGPFMRDASDTTANATKRIRMILGDLDDNGYINGGEREVDQPFLLWSAGPDQLFGPSADAAVDPQVDVAKCDDVTNFR